MQSNNDIVDKHGFIETVCGKSHKGLSKSICMTRTFRYSFVALFVAFLFYLSGTCLAQEGAVYLPASTFFERLEERHSVNVFYRSDWFYGKELNSALLERPFEEALAGVTSGLNLTFLYIEDYIVIVPSESVSDGYVSREGDMVVVGNPMELGRYSRVQVEGKVNDGETGEPLIGAMLYDEQSGLGVTTDMEGQYSLVLPVGETRIRLSYVGYEEAYYNIRVIGPGNVDFELFEYSVHIEGATVTAYRQDANIRSTQMSTVRLDPVMLKDLPGAYGERDIIRGFTLLPGIQSMGEFGTGFNVRGGDSDQNLILVEDMPLFNSSHLFGLVSIVNPDMVTEVNLMKAGIPARYGERASSIIDIRKRGSNPEKTSLRGGIGLLYSRLHLESPLFNDKASLSVGGRSSYSNWLLDRVPDQDLMNSSAGFYDLSAVFSYNLHPNHTLSVFGYQSKDDFLLAGESEHAYKSQLASMRLNSVVTPRLTSRLMAGFSRYKNEIRQPADVDPRNAFSMNSDIGYSTVKWQFDYGSDSGKQSFDFGLQGVHYSINPGDMQPLGSGSFVNGLSLDTEQGLEVAAFASGVFELSEALSAEVGLRGVWYGLMGPARIFEYRLGRPRIPENIVDTTFFPQSGTTVWSDIGLEPRVGLRLMLTEESSVKFSYNRNHQFVNLLSNTAVMAPTDVWRLSTPFTGALESNQLAIGYYKLFASQGIEVSLESYYKFLNNIVEYRDGANVLMNPYVETDLVRARGYSYGAELYLKKRAGSLTGWLSYTWSRTMRRSLAADKMFQINNNNYFPSAFDRPHNLVVNGTYRFTRRWRTNATFVYNTGRPVTYPEQVFNFQGHEAILYSDRNKYRLPDYHRLDISVTWDENLKLNARGKGSWTFSLINVYGRKNAHSVFYKKEEPSPENNQQRYSLYKMYIIGRPLPTITYNFSF